MILWKGQCSCQHADGTTKRVKATKSPAFLKCLRLCRKVEVDCYFECGKNNNVKSLVSYAMWKKCTDSCDKAYNDCKGWKVKQGKDAKGLQ